MKTIIDSETGELVEVEEKNDIATRKMTELGLYGEDVSDLIAMFKYYEDQFKTFKFQLQKAMEENGIKSWKTDEFTATIREESMQKRLDTERLKEDGLYDKYLKLVPVASSLTLKLKER